MTKKNTKTRKNKECPKKCPRKTRCNKKKGVCEPIEGQKGGTNGDDGNTTRETFTNSNIDPFDVPDDLSEIGYDDSVHDLDLELDNSFELNNPDDLDLGLDDSVHDLDGEDEPNSFSFSSVLSGLGFGNDESN